MLVIQVIKEDNYRGSSMGIHEYMSPKLHLMANIFPINLELKKFRIE